MQTGSLTRDSRALSSSRPGNKATVQQAGKTMTFFMVCYFGQPAK